MITTVSFVLLGLVVGGLLVIAVATWRMRSVARHARWLGAATEINRLVIEARRAMVEEVLAARRRKP